MFVFITWCLLIAAPAITLVWAIEAPELLED